MTKESVALILCAMALVSLSGLNIDASASTIIVPDDYPTIQEAINNAVSGDTILVKAGTYYEHVVVNRSITLVGEDANTTIIDGNKTGPVVLVTANGVNLAGFTIRAGQNAHPVCNVWLENVSQCSIHGNTLTYGFYGVYLNEANSNNVYENSVTANCSIGVCGFNASWNSIVCNEFATNSWASINLHFCCFNVIVGNLISSSSVGMRLLDGTNNNSIYHNSFVNNTSQIYIQSSYNNTWDDGYPSGGNYWSNYGGLDQFGGFYQNVTGSDGIGDTPYTIDAFNVDHFPLMLPYNPSPVGGDLNADGFVDIFDIVIVALEFGRPPPPIEDARADVNKDGVVDIIDIAIVAIHFGESA
jgi:parallel beta-helix repeat protein